LLRPAVTPRPAPRNRVRGFGLSAREKHPAGRGKKVEKSQFFKGFYSCFWQGIMYNKITMGDKGRMFSIAYGRRPCRPPDRPGQMYRERGICNMAKLDLTKYGISGTT